MNLITASLAELDAHEAKAAKLVNECVTKRAKLKAAQMELQQDISKGIQDKFVGQTIKVLIEEQQKDSEDVYLGRTEFDAPEVDGLVYVHSQDKLDSGDFVHVKITDALEYDLIGERV